MRVSHQDDPMPLTADDWRERQRRTAPGAFRRFLVGEVGDEIVAMGALLDHDLLENGVAARIVVETAHRRQGLGRALSAAVDALIAERAPTTVEVRVKDSDPASRAWAERRGFRLQRHMVRSRLDLHGFDPVRHRFAVERAESAGHRFETPSDLDRLYALFAALVPDAPDGLAPPASDTFRRQVEDHPGFVQLIASHGAAWVGMAAVEQRGEDGAWNAFTGVLPAYRGRGLARALKVVAAEEMRRRGRHWIETSNNVGNAPMLAVNRALGYVPVAGALYLRRDERRPRP
jgi:GNAT superfamily N-acetyltransferase